jgi:hypothetical protein
VISCVCSGGVVSFRQSRLHLSNIDRRFRLTALSYRMAGIRSISSPANICALCLLKAELRLSHIIPEFSYKPTYDEKHRMHAIPGHAPEEDFWVQKGLRYPLLCDRCEGLLNTNYEDPFKRFWVDRDPLGAMRASGGKILSGIDYSKFKLFHLSILWRASVCRHPAFHRVSLDVHEELIRQMLLARDAGPASLYPVACQVIIDDDDGSICEGVVRTPFSLTLLGHSAFDFMYCGCHWIYFVPSNPPELDQIRLSEHGTMVVNSVSRKELFHRFFEVSEAMAHLHGSVDAKRLLRSLPRHS